MEEIVLRHIQKLGNTISYEYCVSDGLKQFFSGKSFSVEYPERIEDVPDAIAAIPFVGNVLPIIWVTDSVLKVEKLDKAFYQCIDAVRGGFETMFPESTFAGRIEAAEIVGCDHPSEGKSAALFSGGLDAVNTLVSHLDENPVLISIWGADIRSDNAEGWEIVHSGIAAYSRKFQLPDVVIRSTFREFDREDILEQHFKKQLKDGWWHGLKHGIGLLSHTAPYVYLKGIEKVYIASSNCKEDGHIRCSSNPLTDNHIRFAHAQVIHDGFEFSRQDKVRNVVNFVQRSGIQLPLRVCWETQSGGNCCRCEKCYRTMVGLIAEDADPVDYGFEDSSDAIRDLQSFLVQYYKYDNVLQRHWLHVQKSIVRNQKKLKTRPEWKYIRWLAKADLSRPEKLQRPLYNRLGEGLERAVPALYPILRAVKRKIFKT